MKRRRFLSGSACALAVAATGSNVLAAGAHSVPYSRAAYDSAVASGKPFMLDFYASW